MNRLRLRAGRDLTCQHAVELVTSYLEGTLPPTQRRRFGAHLASCPDCPEYLAQVRAVIALAGSVTPDDLTSRMRSELIRLYRRWLAESA